MILSPNKIMGSLVYRTRKALRGNPDFLKGLQGYDYAQNCFLNGEFNLWHYPGTHNEISNAFRNITRPDYKFPAILNFQSMRQRVSGNDTTLYYSLAIVAPVLNNWTTEQREAEVFERVLRPIYEELMRQIAKCEYFIPIIGMPNHDRYDVYTTGKTAEQISNIYGEHIDALEIHNLGISLNSSTCEKRIKTIETENDLVTKNINEKCIQDK